MARSISMACCHLGALLLEKNLRDLGSSEAQGLLRPCRYAKHRVTKVLVISIELARAVCNEALVKPLKRGLAQAQHTHGT